MNQKDNSYMTPINTTMVVINVIVFFILDIVGNTESAGFMFEHGAMFPLSVLTDHEYYRLITCAFIHFGIYHLINNMVMLVCLGSYVERALGKIKYLIFYLLTAVISSLVSMWYMLYTNDLAVSGGASGVIFAMIGALLYLVIRYRGRFENLTMTRFLIMVALSLYYGFTTTGVDNAAHVGGLCAGFVLCFILYRRQKHTI